MSGRVQDVAVVAIGRNEGERLEACLRSVVDAAAVVVYVDSGSQDDSVAFARSLGVEVVQLDMSLPFSAARARNAGWRRVQQIAPDITLVQFVDGDCAVAEGWLRRGADFLATRPDVACVCGRRRERHPERSIYNQLCDFEWDAPAGEVKACGGDVMTRMAALQEQGGYRDACIAGEEAELCVRLRAAGWRIWRLPDEMTLHDAAMTRLSQWWRRSVRTGFTYAQGADLHGAPPERHKVSESRSAWLWGLVLPLGLLVGAWLFGPWVLWGFMVYPLQMVRLFLLYPRPARPRAWWAMFLVLGKFAEVVGQFKYLSLRWSGRRAQLIEYK